MGRVRNLSLDSQTLVTAGSVTGSEGEVRVWDLSPDAGGHESRTVGEEEAKAVGDVFDPFRPLEQARQ
jgi:hypothetical protein